MDATAKSENPRDWLLDQRHEAYTETDHATWRTLARRQREVLRGRIADAFLDGLDHLDIGETGIPDFRRLNERLSAATGWEVVAVPGLVPDLVFFKLLADRKFPAGYWIRKPEQLDYIEEPDVFHDVFGHVPLIMQPVYADYLAAYGRAGLEADAHGALHRLARLYWYTVEFGLINTPAGLRIYGSGIVSSKGESIYCLDDLAPNRLGFDLERVMRTRYRIDTYQKTYFVIDGFEQLFDATRPDFTPLYARLAAQAPIAAGDVLPTDRVFHHGTGAGWADEGDV